MPVTSQRLHFIDKCEIRDHLVDALIKTTKYPNGPHNGCIGSHISLCIFSKNLGDSPSTLLSEGLVTRFPIECVGICSHYLLEFYNLSVGTSNNLTHYNST